jgi:ribonuclease HI
MEKYIKNWKSNGWKLSDGESVKNKKDLLKLNTVCSKIPVLWTYVAGHSNGNEKAEELAKTALIFNPSSIESKIMLNSSSRKNRKETKESFNENIDTQKMKVKDVKDKKQSEIVEYIPHESSILPNLLKPSFHLNNSKISFSFNKTKVSVYTDGACSNNGNRGAIAGIGVFWGLDHPLNISRRLTGRPTNNRAEIMAALVAIEQATFYDASAVNVLTDSKFVIDCMEKYVKNWKTNGWKLSDGKPVKNKEDFIKLDHVCSKIPVLWIYVPGHRNVYGNEKADELAKRAL